MLKASATGATVVPRKWRSAVLGDLPGIRITDFITESQCHVATAEYSGRPECCPSCAHNKLVVHGAFQQRLTDLPFRNLPVRIELRRKRYLCTQCRTTFSEPIDWLDDVHRATKRLCDSVAELSLEQPFVEQASTFGISEKTVRSIFYQRFQEVIEPPRFESPAYLGIHMIEIASRPRIALTNLEQGTAIDFLPNFDAKVLNTCFRKMPQRERIQAISIGMWPKLRPILARYFPDAAIVIDRSHLLEMSNAALEKVFRDVLASCKSREKQKALKEDHPILHTSGSNLTDSQVMCLAVWRKDFPLLAAAYDANEMFNRIFIAKTSRQAIQRVDAWERQLPENLTAYWKDTIAAWQAWRTEILNAFEIGLSGAYASCHWNLASAIKRQIRKSSFPALRVNLLRLPQKMEVLDKRPVVSGSLTRCCVNDTGQSTSAGSASISDARTASWGIDLRELPDK